MTIGVFDSGIGGLSVLRALRDELPHEEFVYLADTGYAPYGERDEDYVIERTRAVVRRLVDEHQIQALVIACNTATAAAIHLIRGEHPALITVGVEPALKSALALSKTRRIGVIATRGTLASSKFRQLHDRIQDHAQFVLQPCDGLAKAIEDGECPRVVLLCSQYISELGEFGNEAGQIDTLVLGCTHYAFAQRELAALTGPGVHLVETGAPVARQTRRLLAATGRLNGSGSGDVRLLSTGALPELQSAARRWLGL